MFVSGENYIYTPRTQEMSFVFENLYVDKNGVAEVGFSGDSSSFYFLISGGRLVDPSNNFVYTCGPDNPVTISGDFNGSKYRYYLDGKLSADGKDKAGFNVEKFYTKTTDCNVGLGLQMFCQPISHKVEFDSVFSAGKALNGRVFNYSNIDFEILSSKVTHPGYTEHFTGYVTGVAPAGGVLNFQLWDVSDMLSIPEADASITLDTTIGTIEHSFSPTRSSGFFGDVVNLDVAKDGNSKIEPWFDGTGDCKKFAWRSWPTQHQTYPVFYSSKDENFNERTKPLWVSLKNVSPNNQSVLTGTYISSYFVYDSGADYCLGEGSGSNACAGEVVGSGRYLGVPSVEFLTYSNVTGVTFNSNNLFSSGTPSKIPMLFSGYSGELGDGASGYFLTEPYQLNLSSEGVNSSAGGDNINWKRITGYEMTNFGTGYTRMPAVFATTGDTRSIGNSTYTAGIIIGGGGTSEGGKWYRGEDVAYSANAFTNTRFAAETRGESLASAMTGLPYFVTTGNSVYGLSGIVITNPGSGYDPNLYVPNIRIKRLSTDTLGTGIGDNFSGEFIFNKSGTTYNFTDVWGLETGLVDSYSSEFKGADFKTENYIVNNEEYSHTTSLSSNNTQFYAKVTFNNLDVDETIAAKLTISGESKVHEETISVYNLYTEESGMAYVPDTTMPSSQGSSFVTSYFGGG